MRAKLTSGRDALQTDALQREGLRLLAALAALLAAALVAVGGLLWREHARAQPQVHPASMSAVSR
jgi:hypothetical protein